MSNAICLILKLYVVENKIFSNVNRLTQIYTIYITEIIFRNHKKFQNQLQFSKDLT